MEIGNATLLHDAFPIGVPMRDVAQRHADNPPAKGNIMERFTMLGALGMVLVGLVCAATCSPGEDPKKNSTDHQAADYEACAKACADCARQCESCARHCADLMADGKK